MSCSFIIFSQSDSLIQIVDINSDTNWQTEQIQISWLLQKPTDLDLHCLQKQGIIRGSAWQRLLEQMKWFWLNFMHTLNVNYWDQGWIENRPILLVFIEWWLLIHMKIEFLRNILTRNWWILIKFCDHIDNNYSIKKYVVGTHLMYPTEALLMST